MTEPEEEEGGFKEPTAPAWMATFGDMMSLLLCFFVLLLSFANMDVVKFESLVGSLSDAFGQQSEHPGAFAVTSTSPIEMSLSEAADSIQVVDLEQQMTDRERAALDEIEKFVSAEGLEENVETEFTQRGIVVRVKGELLFQPGSAELRAEAFPLLSKIAKVAKWGGDPLAVEGHTDDLPIATQAFPSNWHLSSSRAISVLQFVQRAGPLPGERLTASSFAQTRPLRPNSSQENRAVNRRVEFVFERSLDPDRNLTRPLLLDGLEAE